MRRPASRSRSSRSRPIDPAEHAGETHAQGDFEPGEVRQRDESDSRPLRLENLVDPGGRQIEQLVQAFAAERVGLRRCLHLDQAPVPGHHDVHVHLRLRVLVVGEVEQRHAADDADRNGGDLAGEGPRQAEAVEGTARSDPRAGDRGTARAAVGLKDVAVEPERALAERLEVGDRRAARGRSAAGSRPCARPACRARPRARYGHRSTRGAASTPPSSSRGRCGGASAGRPPRSSPCRGRASSPARTGRPRAAARGTRCSSVSGRS